MYNIIVSEGIWPCTYGIFFLLSVFFAFRSRNTLYKVPRVTVPLICLVQTVKGILSEVLQARLAYISNLIENYYRVHRSLVQVSFVAKLVTDILIVITIISVLKTFKSQVAQDKQA